MQLIDDPAPHSAPLNMAIDEVLLGTVAVPTLRFYRWLRPSLSFGYFGRFAAAAEVAGERDVVRRWTGGGIVLHGDDTTYSLILPRSYVAEPWSGRATYAFVHTAIAEVLSGSVDAHLAKTDAPKISEACFANAVVADVLIGARKIAGAAQRRTRAGLLHQGSIQHENLPTSFADALAGRLCSGYERVQFATPAAAEPLAAEKYATAAWSQRR
ncbi:MAG: hypothetical protein M3Y80_00410 [Verrucomicrobiota bacterium]|nr:hypothetical protein [Verrucomicrobiota bacterium]